MRPLASPHGISPEPFLVYPLDLRRWVTIAFWTLRSSARSSASVALLSSFCSSGHDFAMASSPLCLAAQSLPVAIGFVGNYAPWDFHPSFGTCPSYRKRPGNGSRALSNLFLYWACSSASAKRSGITMPACRHCSSFQAAHSLYSSLKVLPNTVSRCFGSAVQLPKTVSFP